MLAVLGKDSYEPDRKCGRPLTELPDSPHFCPIAGGFGIDGHGNILVSAFLRASDVFRFPAPIAKAGSPLLSKPDKRLFHPPGGANFQDRRGIQSARGVVAWKDQLIASDIGRLLFWNGLDDLANGQAASGVVGAEFLEQDWPGCCGRIKADDSGNLWVLGFEGIGLLDVYELPLNDLSVPIHTMWTDEMVFPVMGTDSETRIKSGIQGLAPVGTGEFLWLSDTDNHRVLRIRDPLTDPVVDVVLGQRNATDTRCNQGGFPAADRSAIEPGEHGDVLCFPGALSIDGLGNLYVSDHALETEGNGRLLLFSPESVPTTNTRAIFAPLAAKIFVRSATSPTNLWAASSEGKALIGQDNRDFWSAATWEPAFDSTNRMVVGYNAYLGPRFVGIYDDPLGNRTLPDSYLYDFGSMPYAATFDDSDNLYVGDINRGRVLVYENPFNNPTPGVAQRPGASPKLDSILPQYPTTIESVRPPPPFCVLRNSPRGYETTLELIVDGLPKANELTLEFRRVAARHREYAGLDSALMHGTNFRITLSQASLWQRLWRHIDRPVLTVRLIGGGPRGTPLSNWSPAFLLAEDASSCGTVLPPPEPTPTPTAVPTPVPTPTALPTHVPTPDALTAAISTSTVLPAAEVTQSPEPTRTPSMPSSDQTSDSQGQDHVDRITFPTPVREPSSKSGGCMAASKRGQPNNLLAMLALLILPVATIGWRRLRR